MRSPPVIVAGPRPATVVGLLLLTLVTAAFGNSLQPIAVLAWLQPLVLLLAYEGAVRTLRSSIVAHLAIILTQALGFTFAFAGALSYPRTTPSSLLQTLGLGTVIATATTLGALLPAARLRLLAADLLPAPPPRGASPHPFPPKSLTPLGWLLLSLPIWAYPVLQSAVFTVTGFKLGHFHEPGVALSDWPAVAQLASLFGLWGLNFLLSLAASAACCIATYEPLPLTATAEPSGSFSDTTAAAAAAPAAAAAGGGAGRWSRLHRSLRRHVLGVAWVLWLLLLVGGGLVYNDSFYQRPVGRRLGAERRLPVSCLATEAVDVGSEGYVWLWQKTGERVAAGDRIVLWSEEAVMVRTASEEMALLAAGRDLLAAHGSADPDGGTYLGLCYEKLLLAEESRHEEGGAQVAQADAAETEEAAAAAEASSGSGAAAPAGGAGAKSARRASREVVVDPPGTVEAGAGTGGRKAAAAAAGTSAKVVGAGGGGGGGSTSARPARVTNHFVLLGPNGSTLWDYRKAFPVPIIEAQVVAGPPRLPTAPSPYGTLGGAICFDMDRPQYVRQAGAAGVALLLQPSWTWGAVGPRHFASDALRAIEDGFTIFRCSSDGVSGVVSPRGVAAHYLLTGEQDVLTFSLPLQPRVRTAYVVFGWALEWANLAAAVALLALLALPRCRLARWVAWSRSGGDSGSDDGARTGDGHEPQRQQQEPLLRNE
ncbi:hypothetical protein PLESTB_001340700 [Pleodorina starrii]|uniref:CN hydrolase domain-containing protein n=1 Tax=Pleodorina starrii TaxID=330485 RepID=A0A9W6F750_9CHLO|nr:hypothetical protein PLESTM_001458400 [Pleodorina starrii]GLC58275.1 hypothetical protein PLESTB_001340700 [Pleodorina starrii]GLC66374.1 hypothetical protein PLESTF_000417700 [Pleodorina starrii]